MRCAEVPPPPQGPRGGAASWRTPWGLVRAGGHPPVCAGWKGGLPAPIRRLGGLAAALLLASGPGCVGPGETRTNTAPAIAEETQYQLDESVAGRIVLVNSAMQFVVMDFPLRRLPVLEQRLAVFRAGRKVGEIRVTGPFREMTVAGEILSGNLEAGDEVREE